MNETDWLACAEPHPMLNFLDGRASGRKLRLFAAACCRRIWGVLADPLARRAVEIAEEYADGRADDDALARARRAAETARGFTDYDSVEEEAVGIVISLAHRDDTLAGIAAARAAEVATWAVVQGCPTEELEARFAAALAAEQSAQAALLRELFGNPFRPVTPDPEWHTTTAVQLARQMVDANDFSAMPILADALEDAGCGDEEVLAHCRGPGPHVRGCWVVDLVLEKS
jgi:hypothetical protein